MKASTVSVIFSLFFAILLPSCSEDTRPPELPHKQTIDFIHQGDADKAVEMLIQNSQGQEKNPQYWSLLGYAYSNTDPPQLEKALSATRAALEFDPEDGYKWFSMSTLLQGLGRSEEAVNAAKMACEKDPEKSAYFWNLGQIQEELDDLPGAIDAFEKSIALKDADSYSWLCLIRVFEQSGEISNALATFEKAVQNWPEDLEVRSKYAYFLGQNGKLDQAVSEYSELIDHNPENGELLQDFFWLVNGKLPSDEAVVIFSKMVEKHPGTKAMIRCLGLSYLEGKQWHLAEIRLKEAIELGCSDPDVWKGLVMSLSGQGKLELAKKALNEGLSENPQSSILWQTLAQFECVLGNTEAAFDAATEFLKTSSDPTDEIFWQSLATGFSHYADDESLKRLFEMAKEQGVPNDQIADLRAGIKR